jgi:hypothetical protein
MNDVSASTRDSGSSVDDYEEMLATLDVAIEEAQRKIESGRVYDAENEKIRCKWIRTLAYTVNIRRQVTNDRDLEELAEEVERLKAQQGAAGLEVSTR